MDADDPIRGDSLQPKPSPTAVGRRLANEQRWLPGERQTLGCLHLALVGVVVSVALLGVLFDEVSWPRFFAVEAVCIVVLMGAIDVLRRRRAGVVLLMWLYGCLMVCDSVSLWNAIQRLGEPLPALRRATDDGPWFEQHFRIVALYQSVFILLVAGLMLAWLAWIKRRVFPRVPSRGDTFASS